MSAGAALIAAATVAALVDWWAVTPGRERQRVEFVAKPLVMVLLLLALLFADGDATVVALIGVGFAFSLVGDVVLMWPDGPFEAGLGAFLVAHGFTISAFLTAGVDGAWLIIGLVIAAVLGGLLARPIVAGAARSGRVLAVAVTAYIVVLATMTVTAVGVGHGLTVVGGVLFLVSDALLGWGRFVGPTPGGRAGVHVTYHLAQIAFASWAVAVVT